MKSKKAGRVARRGSERRSAITQTLKNTVKKSFKAGKAKGASTTVRRGSNATVSISRKAPLAKAAGKAGSVVKSVKGSTGKAYKMTQAHKNAIPKALKGKKRR